MSNFVNVIKACESASGAGTKKTIQAALSKSTEKTQALIHAAMDPYKVYGVRKLDPPLQYATYKDESSTQGLAESNFLLTLTELAKRNLTGDAARAAVTECLGNFSKEDAEYYERIINKDLRAGFSASTFNKIFPKNPIASFEVMLADKCEDVEDFEKNIRFPCQADFKYDGERTIAFVKSDGITYYSRSGKEASHVNGLFDEELIAIHQIYGEDFVLDGERFASDFTETVNAKKSGNDEAKKNLRLRAFFLMPLTDWLTQKTTITMRANRKSLGALLNKARCKKIILSEGREVVDYADMMAYCNTAIDDHGVEGLILKDWDACYEWDRKMTWCKVKRMWDADCKIVGFYNGRPKSRLENTLGGINVIGYLEDGTYIECNVGSGFSDELRNEIWDNQKEWLNRTVVIKYQEVSKSKSKNAASLRFPIYMHDRDDKVVE